MKRNLHTSIITAAALFVVAVFLAVGVNPASAVVITELTWNDSSGNVTSTSGDGGTNSDTDIDRDSTLVSFKVGSDEFSNFVLVDSATFALSNGDISPFWGANAAVPLTIADDTLSVTDNRLDTGLVNMGNGGEFFFPSSPTSLDEVLFIFEVGSNDGGRNVSLIDGLGGNIVGSTVIENFDNNLVADIDFTRANGAGTVNTSNTGFKGRAISFGAGFGLTAAQLSSVAGVRIDGNNGLDPSLVGFTVSQPANVPEPTTAVLGLIGIAGLVRRRRKAA